MIEDQKSPMDLPKDIIEDMLMGFSVKSLSMLKCVSKDWNNFISDGSFRRRYHSLQKSKCNAPTGFICHGNASYSRCIKGCMDYMTPNMFVYTSEYYVEKDELKYLPYLRQFGCLMAASKGLLLLCHYSTESHYVYDLVSKKHVNHSNERLYVYDLVSKKYVNLPKNLVWGDCVSWGFKCEENTTKKGFTYEVVCVGKQIRLRQGKGFTYNVQIYSSKTRSWRKSIMKIESTFYVPSKTSGIQPYFMAKVIGGVLHWHELYSDNVIAYDSGDREGHTVIIEFPSTEKGWDRWMNNFEGTKDGSLRCFSVNGKVANVWILTTKSGRSYMDEDIVNSNMWSLVHSVSLLVFRGVIPDYYVDIIGFDPTDADIMYVDTEGQIYAYNHVEGKVVFKSSQWISWEASIFIHFEWPTWPCL